MRALKLVLPAVLLMAGFLVCTTASTAPQDYAKKEKKACTFCHGKVDPADKEADAEEPQRTPASITSATITRSTASPRQEVARDRGPRGRFFSGPRGGHLPSCSRSSSFARSGMPTPATARN